MTKIMLEVPEEWAGRITQLQGRLPQLLSVALDMLEPPQPNAHSPLLSEIVDFLARGPSPLEIVDFKVSNEAQARLEELLDQNRESDLSPQEQAELNTYQQANHLLILLKARARSILAPLN